MESIDAYKVLGLCTDANARDVRSAFRRISLKLHPDRGGDPEAFRRASQAAELLLGDSHVDTGSTEPPIKQRGNVRGFFDLDGVLAVVDEACASIQGEAIVHSAHDEVLLCGCALGSQACVGTSKGRIYLAGERGGRTLVGGGPAVLALAASAAPPLLVASIAGETTLLEAAEGGAVRSLAADIFGVLYAEAICALPRGCGDGAAALFVVGGSGDAEAEGGGDGRGRAIALDADVDGAVTLWDVAFDAPVFAVAATAAPPGASAKVLVAVASGGEVHLVSGAAGERLLRIDAVAHPGVLYAVAFSPSGTALVASGSEVIDAFNVPAGTRRARLRLPRGTARECHLNTATITALAFDGELNFVSGGWDAAVTVWQLPPPPEPPAVRDCATCPTATECEKGRAALAAAGVPAEQLEW